MNAISRLRRAKSSSKSPPGRPHATCFGGAAAPPPRAPRRAGGCLSHQNHWWPLGSRRASPRKGSCKAPATEGQSLCRPRGRRRRGRSSSAGLGGSGGAGRAERRVRPGPSRWVGRAEHTGGSRQSGPWGLRQARQRQEGSAMFSHGAAASPEQSRTENPQAFVPKPRGLSCR